MFSKLVTFVMCALATAAPFRAPTMNIVELAASVPDLSTLVTAVKAAGLVDTLEGAGPFTVFAPTNEAFAALPAGLLQKLLEPANKATLVAVLTYHVVAGDVQASMLKNDEKIKTVEGSNVTAFVRGSEVAIEGGARGNLARVVKANVEATNGVVHVIDRVLIPPSGLAELLTQTIPSSALVESMAPTMNIVELAASVPDLSTLVTAVKAAGLVDTLEGAGPFTVFAPTNEAFAALPAGLLQKLLEPANKATLVAVLTYHVVAGDVQASMLKDNEKIKTVEGSNVTAFVRGSEVAIEGGARGNLARVVKANVEATNGVVHVIDRVLIPPSALAELMAPTMNIVELAASVPDLSTLVTAVKAAGLVDTLEGAGPFTVFAPTNEAFAALPAGLLQKLLEPANKATLVAVLTYHVVAGDVQASMLKDNEKIKTVEGSNVTAFVRGSEVAIEGGMRGDIARVVKANVEATNGVVHVVDHVLIPPKALMELLAPTMNIVELAASVPELSTLVTALKAADLVTTLEGAGPFTVFAPTNAAFAALPEGVLQKLLEPANKAELVAVLTYHVASGNVQSKDLKDDEKVKTVEGSNVTVFIKGGEVIIEGGMRGDYARVVKADVEATNGVVHVIDHVLLPPRAPGPAPSPSNRTIVELAASNPDLSTLVTALKAADLVTTLEGAGPFTVFAPTNEAFAALPEGILKRLLEPANKAELVAVLTYHVASGNVQAKDLKDDEKVTTVEGEDVTVYLRDRRAYIKGYYERNFAEVVKFDVEATNGVVHVINQVLLPHHTQQNTGYELL